MEQDPICTWTSENALHQSAGDWALHKMFWADSFLVVLNWPWEWKHGPLKYSPSSPRSIYVSSTASRGYPVQTNYRIVSTQQVQMGVLI